MGFRALVVVVAVTHLAFVAYVLGGGFLAARRPVLVVPHLVGVGWALAGFVTPVACPLTAVENALRRKAGEPMLKGGLRRPLPDGRGLPRTSRGRRPGAGAVTRGDVVVRRVPSMACPRGRARQYWTLTVPRPARPGQSPTGSGQDKRVTGQ